jgi:hypothetical protein
MVFNQDNLTNAWHAGLGLGALQHINSSSPFWDMDTSRGSFDSVEEEQETQTFDHFDKVL